ncbi:EamA family transporter [Vibrio mediterranei]|uniref:DMT family transporter n=1 Tax=Vibrio TaxID=662 RepID=UPI000D1828E2|nr:MULTISPECIES: DMT family transporter [Vibrio]MCF4172763.1 DMT family transporter [Vibrio sp. McD22-P3]MCG9659359.1 DMT family transporter [Vibrio mediterranei]MCG9663481.1 DMT family transporter [Vibrio mediterranei]PTC06887.1 EamA family transporter [Vibrio mediterranei]
MKPMTVGVAMLLLVFGNQIAILSDALIKSVGNDVAVFQFVFFRQLSAVLILLPFFLFSKPKNITEGLKWHALRAHVWLFGAIFMVYAISSMPLATANAIFYAAPLMMLPLAGLFFGEKLSRQTIAAAVMGFAGVLVIIRPDQVDFAALSALVVALTIAVNNLLIRKLPKQQSVVHTLLVTNLVGMPVSLCLAYMEGQPWDWSSFPVAAASSTFILIYAATCVLTYRSVDSNKIASAEYSGLIGAVAVGLLWFGEVPDIFMAIGTLMIVVPIVWLTKHEKKRKRMHKETAIVES